MTRLTLRTPSRLHFGLLSWGPMARRQFGGVGLMIDEPGLTISASQAERWEASGPLASRVLEFASRVSETLAEQGLPVEPLAFEVQNAPPEHAGLGVGTQLGLGVARLVAEFAGAGGSPDVGSLARLSGRGLRSGIGLHGFGLGGLIVDGGRARPEGIPPLLTHLEFPKDWSILVVIPRKGPGIHGLREVQAFSSLPPSPDSLTEHLCRLVLLGLLPAVVERDLSRFGEALEEIQREVGEGFAPAQGGTFARPESESILESMKEEGLTGVGQSSWGPTLYGFIEASTTERSTLLERIHQKLGLAPGSAFWTRASLGGASIRED